MMGPTYMVANLTAQRDQQFRMQVHKKRLDEIRRRHKSSFARADAKTWHPRQSSFDAERNYSIEQGNKLLIAKLLKISKRKFPWASRSSVSPTSLNIRQRKQKFEEISAENVKFARRIVSQSGVLTSQELDKWTQDLSRYREISSRMRLLEVSNKVNKGMRLPGIARDRSVSPGGKKSSGKVQAGGLRRVVTERINEEKEGQDLIDRTSPR